MRVLAHHNPSAGNPLQREAYPSRSIQSCPEDVCELRLLHWLGRQPNVIPDVLRGWPLQVTRFTP